ncbi:hypothetical protein AMJ39_07965 [candidate division TA06 bacterium DG_24]|uniref:Uncharacterized protein n=2 Tax=Bacteria division TA06 TaxID=1156500 RepID=A0A0S8J8N4_UNCT6|nr:MAG: hypothetical protein AMJ39_07965 [candidate division TA06 bacterium DG_24]KPL05840.1 MAG: hypothetical protein AMJ71_10670 [candidate division TA06 bacterium SM1_40]
MKASTGVPAYGRLAGSVLLVVVFTAAAVCQGYELYNFRGTYEQYVYEMKGEEETTYFSLTIDPKGDDQFMVSVEYKKELEKEDLGEALFAGAMGVQWVMFFNPMIFMYLGMGSEELAEEGDKFLIPGGGRIQFTGTETVAGQKGKVYRATLPDEEESVFECVLSQNHALPLRVTAYEEDKLEYEAKLISYKSK